MAEAKKMLLAFDIYAKLAANGQLRKLDVPVIWEDEEVRHALDEFVRHVQCTLLTDADNVYLIPLAVDSPFHISNETFKKKYMTAKSVNMDMYLLYLTIIVLFGCFYDSYTSNEPNDFVTMEGWLEEMNRQIATLHHHDEATLQEKEAEQNFNWLALMRKWDDMDDLKETVKKQDARTNSRLSFLNMARNFLLKQKLVRDIGADQLELTEKARTILADYFMEEDYNHGILDFMYELDHKSQEGEEHAIH